MKKINIHNLGATILGSLTSICLALAFFDWDQFDAENYKHWLKIIIIAIPALGGSVSSINTKKHKNEDNNPS